MGANSFRKRVFQGPLTLGLHSTTFRSALPSATLPYPRKFFLRDKPRTCHFAFFCSRRLQPTFALRGCSLRFSPVRVPAQVPLPRKPRTCLSRFFFVSVGYYRHSFFAGALTGFHLFGYPCQFHHPANRALVFFRSLHSRRLQPTFAFRGCSLRFSPVRVPAQVSKPRKPRTSFFRFLLFPSVTTDVCFSRVLSQVFTCSGTRASSITAQTAHLSFRFLLFLSVRTDVRFWR